MSTASEKRGRYQEGLCSNSSLVMQAKTAGKISTLDMGRADFGLPKELASKIPWESAFAGIGVYECWSFFKSHFLGSVLVPSFQPQQ